MTKDNTSPPGCYPGIIAASLEQLALDYYVLALSNRLLKNWPRDIDGKNVPTDLLGWIDVAYNMGLGAKQYNEIKVVG